MFSNVVPKPKESFVLLVYNSHLNLYDIQIEKIHSIKIKSILQQYQNKKNKNPPNNYFLIQKISINTHLKTVNPHIMRQKSDTCVFSTLM